MSTTYLFYDIEATGLDCSFDQPIQFAAIRTDTSLRELERYKISICLTQDVVPSPSATLTHRISIEKMQQGISGLEAVQQIHQLFNTPGTISIGYNSLGFDDEFLRFFFYRHLLPPYTHQFANGCSRADIYPMTLAYFLNRSETIRWPVTEKGKPTFKLANLNKENNWAQGPAHDALVDVEATLGLARGMKQKEALWSYLIGEFDKKTAIERLAKLPILIQTPQHAYAYGLLIDSRVGIKRQFITPVILLGYHNQYKNQMLCLQIDTSYLKKTTLDTLPKTTHVFRKKLGEGGFILPPKPRYLDLLQKKSAGYLKANLKWLENQKTLLDDIRTYHQSYLYHDMINVDADAALYLNDFPSQSEIDLCRQFHQLPPEKKASLLDKMTHPNLLERAIRVIGRYYPHQLPEKYVPIFHRYLDRIHPLIPDAQALLDYRGKSRLTCQKALKEIGVLLESNSSLDQEQHTLLEELKAYLINQSHPIMK